FQAEDGIRDATVTGVQTCALPILTIGVEQWTFGGVECSSLAICGSEMFLVAQGLATGHHRPISLHHNLGIVVRKYERVVMTDYRSEERRVGKSLAHGGRCSSDKKK